MSLSEALATSPELVEEHLGRYADIATNPFVALNTAFVREGVFLHIPDGVAIEEPIHVVFGTVTSNIVTHPRMLIVAGKNTEVKIVESWVASAESYFNNPVTEMVCGENASLCHCRVQHESRTAFHVAAQQAHLARSSRFSTENISLGGALVRNDVGAWLGGEGIDCRLDGLYLASERQHVDNHTFVRHAEPHCHSFELYKGILAGRARGVFSGRIYVDQDAQKTDAKQENNCILLSDDARVNSSPQLEIFADDVKCTHGATVGQLDQDAIFYLRSRGINAEEARHMLIHAFAGEVLERVVVDDLRERLEVELFWWLSKSVGLQVES
jgi:Fe-S cluster assembly protein SufD